MNREKDLFKTFLQAVKEIMPFDVLFLRRVVLIVLILSIASVVVFIL